MDIFSAMHYFVGCWQCRSYVRLDLYLLCDKGGKKSGIWDIILLLLSFDQHVTMMMMVNEQTKTYLRAH